MKMMIDTYICRKEVKNMDKSLKINTVSLDVQDGIAKVHKFSQPSPFTVSNSLRISFLKLVVRITCKRSVQTNQKTTVATLSNIPVLISPFFSFGSYTYLTLKVTGR